MSVRPVSEDVITKYIVEYSLKEWISLSNVDVVIVGAGPSGMAAAFYLAKGGLRTVVFERRLSFGGGIGGGGNLLHKLVIEEPAHEILREIGVRLENVDKGIYIVDAAEMMAKLAAGAIDAGAKIIHGVTVDDVIYRENPLRITGVAVQWSAIQLSGLHVDPLFIRSEAVVDATGHDAEVLAVVSRKIPESNIILQGEKSAYSEIAENLILEKAGKVIEGLYVTGMAVAALYGIPRMGPIFGSMLLSGKKVAEQILLDLKHKTKLAIR